MSVNAATLPRDLISGLVVFLVALPLCLGVALASNAPLFSGVLAGIIGGILVGVLSGSHTSVSGPAAGLTAVVAAQITTLGFEAFLLAVVIAGVMQVGLGIARAGMLSAFFPSSVIKGLLAAIGIILILKQVPHLLGHDADPEGDMSFFQPDQKNTFTEIVAIFGDYHIGAAIIGLMSLAFLVGWDKVKTLKKSPVPSALLVVLFGVITHLLFQRMGGIWAIGSSHLVTVPVAESLDDFLSFLKMPDFSQITNKGVYIAAVTLAIVASLETLLNLEAVDKLDPQRRHSPPSRELIAQGVGNMASGMVGGLPVTSVIVRSSVNINSGGRTRLSTIFHGTLLIGSVAFFPIYLNMIPLSCLAAILIVTGFKLASPALFRQMWEQGRYQFLPFIITVVAIVLTDLLVGVIIGLVVSLGFILISNLKKPINRVMENHLGGQVLHIELANQVSFLNRAALVNVLNSVPSGGQVLIDASDTDYIDPDILSLIRDYTDKTAPARGIEVSLIGFKEKYQIQDRIQYIDYSTRELQNSLTPAQVIQIFKEGHDRFRSGQRLTRDLGRQIQVTSVSQHPLAVVLSCIDSRAPVELIFDLGVGDIFSVRIAGNITSRKVLASVEYGCSVAGAKVILVMGHTRCGAVTTAVNMICNSQAAVDATGCEHIDHIVHEVQLSVDEAACRMLEKDNAGAREEMVDEVARRNVNRTVQMIYEQSQTIQKMVDQGKIAIVGAMYDVSTGDIEFVSEKSAPHHAPILT